MQDFGDKLEQYMEERKIYGFEGEYGVRNLKEIFQTVCGYSSLEEALADNQFLQMALVEALTQLERAPEEWIENLDEQLAESSSDDEEDE